MNETQILTDCSGMVYQGEKIILQGDNGVGKTTLFRILTGELAQDKGTITFSPHLKIGYLAQLQTLLDPKNTVIEAVQSTFPCSEEVFFSILNDYCLFEPEFRHKKIGQLSTGQQRRLQLALVLIKNPDLLILDEPTNHLDYMSCEYLESQLSNFKGTLLAVSHDRRFIQKLDATLWRLSMGKIHTIETPQDPPRIQYR